MGEGPNAENSAGDDRRREESRKMSKGRVWECGKRARIV